MRCRRCEADNPETARFCDACGAELEKACPGCGALNRPAARFCSQCGSSFAGPPQPGFAERPPAAPEAPTAFLAVEGERKFVTVLFADLRGSTEIIQDLDPEQAIGRLDPGVQAMVDAVQACGGVVNRTQGDGIMALFGAPIAREDHAIRACLAAQQMLRAVAALETPDLEMRVGIHSGEVVIRATGSDASDYDAIGITVHLANRLEQSARPGTVRLSAVTARLARGFTDVLPLGPIRYKGMDAPVEVFELLSANERPSWDVRAATYALTPFIGRTAELSLLNAALGRAGMGRGQAVLVVADAGVGKSRLVHEFLRDVPSGSFAVLRAAAASHASGSPFQAATALLRSWIGAENADSGATIERKLRQALAIGGAAAGLDEPPLRALLDLPIADEEWSALDPARRRERIIDALRNLVLREAAARPLILLVEDLHWVDAPSRAVLDVVMAGLGGARLLLIATTRPDHKPDWSGRSYCTELPLGPLPRDQADALLRQLVGESDELAGLRDRIVQQAEGTPLFLEEISRSLLESGIVVSARTQLEATEQVAIPASVQAIVATRMDRLPPTQRSLLQVASVIGKDLSLDLLRAVARISEERLRADLAGLQGAEFLYEIILPSGTEYTFKHALTQAVAYDSMLRKSRRELHGRVFEALLASAGDRTAELTDLLCEHAWRGELWAEAAEYGQRAGERANSRSAWPEAIAFFERALEALAQLPDIPAMREKRIETLMTVRIALLARGELSRAATFLNEARELSATSGNALRLAHIDAGRCILLTNLGALDEAVEAGRLGHAAGGKLDDAAPLANATFALGQVHWFRGEFVEAERILTAGLPLLRNSFRTRRTGTTGTVSVLSLVCLSKTLAMMGRFDRAFEIAREAQQVANDTALPYDLSYARLAEGFTLFMRGSHPDAVIALEDSLSISRAAGILLLQPSVARYLGRAYAHCGRLQDAHALLDEAIGITKQQSLVGLTAWCSTARGVAHLIADSSESEQALQEAFDLAHRYGYHPVEVHALHALGCLYASRRGDALIKAERCLRDAAAKAEAMEMLPDLAQCLLALGGALRGQNRIADAENAEQRAAQTVYETNRNVLQQPGPSNIRTPGQPMTITH